ncbi:MAG: PsbP-related protein [bacterium]|nr:PsbP-related protein [bacterium]
MKNNSLQETPSSSIASLHTFHWPKWLVILCLLFIPPVAWWHMWRNHRYHTWFPYILWLNAAATFGFTAYIVIHFYPLLTTFFDGATYIFISHIFLLLFSVFEIAFGFYLIEKFKNESVLRHRILAIVIIFLFINTIAIPISQLIITSHLQNRPTIVPVATTNQSIDPTANWKTYNNSEFGFLFMYPPDWKLLPNQYGGVVAIESPTQTDPETKDFIRVDVENNKQNLSIEEYAKRGTDDSIIIEYKNIEIDDITGKQTTDIPHARQSVQTFVKKDDKIYHIGLFSRDSKRYQETYDHILSTFRFTNSD